MGLISALNTALVGLGVNQQQLDVTASNIANADRVGYTRKVLNTSAVVGGDGQVIGTRVEGTSRLLNEQIQTQYQQALSQQQYSSVTADFARYLDNLFGTIQDPGSLPNTANAFSASLANLVSTPEDYPSRIGVIQEAEKFASKLNSLSSQIQDQRQSIEYEIADSVDQVNVILERIKELDTDIVERQSAGTSPVELLDERDRLVTQLSGYIDINVQPTEIGGLRINTAGGLPLYDVDVFKLEFDAHGSIGATSTYSKDPEERGVGTIRITTGQGPGYDVLSLGGFRSGSIAALVEARDETLVAAQRQLDELAANLARTLSTHSEPATAYPASQVPPGDFRPVLEGIANLAGLAGYPDPTDITVNGATVNIGAALAGIAATPGSVTIGASLDFSTDDTDIHSLVGESLIVRGADGTETTFTFNDSDDVATQLGNLAQQLNDELAGGNPVFTVTAAGTNGFTITSTDGSDFSLYGDGPTIGDPGKLAIPTVGATPQSVDNGVLATPATVTIGSGARFDDGENDAIHGLVGQSLTVRAEDGTESVFSFNDSDEVEDQLAALASQLNTDLADGATPPVYTVSANGTDGFTISTTDGRSFSLYGTGADIETVLGIPTDGGAPQEVDNGTAPTPSNVLIGNGSNFSNGSNGAIRSLAGQQLVVRSGGNETAFTFSGTADVQTQLAALATQLNDDLAGGAAPPVFSVSANGLDGFEITASDGRDFSLFGDGPDIEGVLGIPAEVVTPLQVSNGETLFTAVTNALSGALDGVGVTLTTDEATGRFTYTGPGADSLTIAGDPGVLQALGFGDGVEASYSVSNQVGYDFDLAKLQNGDNYTFSIKDLNTGLSKNVTIYRSDVAGEPAITGTRDPNDIYIGIDFSSGDYDAISSAVNDALANDPRIGGALQAENIESGGSPTSGLRIVSSDARNHRIEGAKTNYAVGGPGEFADALSLFTDTGGEVYTGVSDGRSTIDGFAGRIQVNRELVADPGLLVEYAGGIASGDPSRPQALLEKLNNTKVAFSTGAKVGTNNSVFKGSALDFVTTTVSYHARNSSQAEAAAAGQEVATNNLKARFDSSAKVDVDEELGNLIQIQNSYAANARVLQAVRELFETLIRI